MSANLSSSLIDCIEDPNILTKLLIAIVAINHKKIKWEILNEATVSRVVSACHIALFNSVNPQKEIEKYLSLSYHNRTSLVHTGDSKMDDDTSESKHNVFLLQFLKKLFTALDYPDVSRATMGYTALPIALGFSRMTIKDMLMEEDEDEEEGSETKSLINMWIQMQNDLKNSSQRK